MHQKAVLPVIELLHASHASGLVEIRVIALRFRSAAEKEPAYAYPSSFFDCHSFYSHGLEMSEFLIFIPFVKLF